MSLMNDMLRDLEKRQAPDRTQQVEAQGYGALTQKTESHSSRAVILLLAVIIIMLVVLAVGWWYIQTTPQTGDVTTIPNELAAQDKDSSKGPIVGRVDRSAEQAINTEKSQATNVSNLSTVNVVDHTAKNSIATSAPSHSASSNSVPSLKAQPSLPPSEAVAVEKASPSESPRHGLAENATKATKAETVAPEASSNKSSVVATKKAAAIDRKKVMAESIETQNIETQKVAVKHPDNEAGSVNKVLVVSPEQRDEQMVNSAEALMARGEREAAKTQLMAFIDAYATDLKSRALMVSLLMQDGLMAEANVLLTDQKVSESSHLRRLKAHWLTQSGQPDEAVALLNSARPDISLDPEYHVLLASLYQQQGFSSEAVATYAELLSYNPKVADWWVGMAIALDSSQQYPSAKKAYQKALQMDGLRFELADFAKQRLATLGG